MSVEEYRIAQLYMIQKKSREESHGAGSGVEILINEPYEDGPGGSGQYTHKIYHIGSHLPGWFRAILPKSALRVEEKAWNAYPYTRTVYTCPFIEKFVLDIETRYLKDGGDTENVFNLRESEKNARTVDIIDIVKDPMVGGDYCKEEDPTLYQSAETQRGPLTDNWRQEYMEACQEPNTGGKSIMCAYKLCKVEFKYWGMQTKIERFIHDIGLRKTMLRAHRQAWCWQDEYYGLTIEDIRELERQTQLALQEKMAAAGLDELDSPVGGRCSSKEDAITLPIQESVPAGGALQPGDQNNSSNKPDSEETAQYTSPDSMSLSNLGTSRKQSWGSSRSHKNSGDGHTGGVRHWKMESLEKLQTSSSDDEEFFDATDEVFEANPDLSLYKSSSMEILTPDDDYQDTANSADSPPEYTSVVGKPLQRIVEGITIIQEVSPLDRRVEHYRQQQQQALGGSHSFDHSVPATPTVPQPASSLAPSVCKTTVLFMVLHGGSIMDTGAEAQSAKYSDISTLRSTLETTVGAHYPAVTGHIAVRVIPCPTVCSETLALLSSLNPYSFTAQSLKSTESPMVTSEALPLGSISLFATGTPEYCDAVATVIAKANSVYNEFLRCDDGLGFNGQVCLIGDSVGSILGYDALCRNNPFLFSRCNSRYGSHGSLADAEHTEADGGDRPPVSKKTNLETIRQVSVSNPDLAIIGGGSGGGSGGNGGSGVGSDSAEVAAAGAPPGAPAQAASGNEASEPMTSRRAHASVQQARHASCPNSRRTSTGSTSDGGKFEFEVTDFFMFGSPLGLVLAYRKMCLSDDKSNTLPRPACTQLYNLFYPSDPCAVRVEPLLNDRFKYVPPNKVAHYQMFPLGDGQSIHVVETVQSNFEVFSGDIPQQSSGSSGGPPTLERRQSNMSITSQMSGHGDVLMTNITAVTSRWWGNKRLDYALYCPDALQSFPTTALPYLLHASFWESSDVAAFILRQIVRQDQLTREMDGSRDGQLFKPSQPREKWLKRRTTIKLRNVAPNHRVNDAIVLEDRPQLISARFMYGPLDMVSLSGERVDVHINTKPPGGEWVFFGTKDTDSNGRTTFQVPKEKQLSQGMYPIKMVVRGDHTSVDSYLTVLPPRTECVVFSIDGSFTASVSIMGKDPKVRAGAVDVVRLWQELGYLILYVSARPDMQQKKVVAWLAQHNFPHGLVSFMDGLSADPLRQKANYLSKLTTEAEIQIHCAYGSNKDMSVYASVGLSSQQIFIVGKGSKKNQKEAQMISDGYAAHLTHLASNSLSRPAVGNARMFIRRGCFSLPGQGKAATKKALRKTVSLPQRSSSREAKSDTTICISESGNTVVDQSSSAGTAVRSRGLSPRVKLAPYRYDSSNI